MERTTNTAQTMTPPQVLTSFDVDIGESRPHFPSPVRDFDINWLNVATSASLPRHVDTQLVQAIPVMDVPQSFTTSQSSNVLRAPSKQLLSPAPATLLPAYRLARPSSAPPAESTLFESLCPAARRELAREVQSRCV